MSDKFDEAVEYFVENPNEFVSAWIRPKGHNYGYLFKWLGPNPNVAEFGIKDVGDMEWVPSQAISYGGYGCPTMVKYDPERFVAINEKVTKGIVTDPRLPACLRGDDWHEYLDDYGVIPRETLEAIAHWQRIVEAERVRLGV